jgi:hypothetical protein
VWFVRARPSLAWSNARAIVGGRCGDMGCVRGSCLSSVTSTGARARSTRPGEKIRGDSCHRPSAAAAAQSARTTRPRRPSRWCYPPTNVARARAPLFASCGLARRESERRARAERARAV